MHEYSICQRIINVTQSEYSRISPPPKKLNKVHVVVGRLHQIIPDYLVSAYALLTKDTDLEGSTMELTIKPVTCKCSLCGWEGQIEFPLFECLSCQSMDVELVSGKELYLDRLEIEEE